MSVRKTHPPPPRSSNYERLRLLNLNFFNQKGFSLVGVLIASTIGTILALGLASSQVNLAKWQRKISTKNKVNWLETRMQSVMSSSTDQVTCLKNLEEQIKGYDFSAPKFCLARDTTTNTKTIETILADISTCATYDVNNCDTSLCIWSPDIRAETHIIAFAESSSQAFNVGKIVEVEGVSQCCFDEDGECPLGSTDDLACYDVPVEGKPDFGKTKVGCASTSPTEEMRLEPTLFGFNTGKGTAGGCNESGQCGYFGGHNTFIGNSAGHDNTFGRSNTFIGNSAGYGNTRGAHNTFIGNWAGFENAEGGRNTFIGYRAGTSNTGNNNTFIGYDAGHDNTANENTFIGNYAGYKNLGGAHNTFMGKSAGHWNTEGGNNTFIGYWAGYFNTTATDNTFIGNSAGYYNKGNHNTFIGNSAGYYNKGNHNTFIGNSAGHDNTLGKENTFIGNSAGHDNTLGKENTFIGNSAGHDNTSGRYNTFMGKSAGYSHKSGKYNIYLGNKAGCYKLASSYKCTGDNNIFIGATYRPTSATDPLNKKLNIGNLIKGNLLAGSKEVNIDGDLIVEGLRGCFRSYVEANSSGKLQCARSDRRLKKQIKPLEDSLSKLMKLSPKTYYWKDKKRGTKKQFGLIAQEVRTEYPEVVSEDSSKKKMLSLNYISFIPILISSLKEMYAFVKSEFKEIKVSLLKEVTKLKTSLLNLKKELKTQNKETKRSLSNLESKLTKENEALKAKNKQIEQATKKQAKEIAQIKEEIEKLKKSK